MKKRIFNIVLTVLMIAVLLPVHALAANTNDEIQITDEGSVTITSEHAAREGIASLQVSLLVQPARENAEVSFVFSDSAAKVAEFRYHEDSGLLNIYLSGTEALFGDSDTLSVGTVVVQDQDGKDMTATVGVEKESLKYVYGTELIIEEAEVPEQPVTINADEPTDPDQPTETDEPTNPDEPTETDEPTNPDEPTETDEPTNPDDGNEDDSKSETLKELEETLKNAESYVEGNYTKESYQAMKKAMEEAKAVLNSPMPTEEELANALQNLQNAMGALVPSNNDTRTDGNNGGNGNDGSGNGNGSDRHTGTDSKPDQQGTDGGDKDKDASVKTGDDMNVQLFMGLLLISVIGIGYACSSLRKQNKH